MTEVNKYLKFHANNIITLLYMNNI